MASAVYLDIDQGSDFSTEFTLQNDNGTPMNLTGFTAYSQIRKSPSSASAYSFNATIVNAAQGVISISLSGIASSTMKPGRYLYDVEVTNGVTKTRVAEGMLSLHAEITRIPS